MQTLSHHQAVVGLCAEQRYRYSIYVGRDGSAIKLAGKLNQLPSAPCTLNFAFDGSLTGVEGAGWLVLKYRPLYRLLKQLAAAEDPSLLSTREKVLTLAFSFGLVLIFSGILALVAHLGLVVRAH
jgi:hypothetical protein